MRERSLNLLSIGNELYKGKKFNELIKELETMQPLPLLKMDQMAHDACKNNNAKLVVVEKEVPLPGGNLNEFKILLGG